MTDNETWLTVLACVGWLAFVVAWLYADAVAGVADRCITLLEECRIDRRSAMALRDLYALDAEWYSNECDRLAAQGNAMVESRDKQIAKLRWRLGVTRGEKKNHMDNAFVFLQLARDSRVQGWKKMHTSDMLFARNAREAAHAAGQGVP